MKKKIGSLDIDLCIFLLLFFGISLVTIYSASTYLPDYLGNLPLKQAIWYAIGCIVILVMLKVGNDRILSWAWYLYIIGVFLLALVLFLGKPYNGSRCWFSLPGIGTFQPSEFMKIILIVTLARFIHDFQESKEKIGWKEEFFFLIKVALIYLIPTVLTFLEPDTGAIFIYTIITIVMLFVSGIHWRWFVILFGGIFAIGVLFFYFYFFHQEMLIQLFGSNLFYRIDRILDWQQGSGMQLENALAAIGSSGLFGHGFNRTPIYFPESGTDFIFAVFASNFGLVGSLLFLGLIFGFDLYLLHIAKGQKKKPVNQYLIAGILGMLLYQQIQNIGMTLGLLPITGITLPFISYGGSSLISYMIMLGIIFNITREKTIN